MRNIIVNFSKKIVANVGTTIFKAISASLVITIAVRIVGWAKEATLAAFFGVSSVIDIYVIPLIAVMFFVGPFAGSMNTLLTRKLVDDQITYGQGKNSELVTQVLIFSLMAVGLILIPILVFMDDFLKSRNLSAINSGKISAIYFWVLPTGILSAMTVVSRSTHC